MAWFDNSSLPLAWNPNFRLSPAFLQMNKCYQGFTPFGLLKKLLDNFKPGYFYGVFLLIVSPNNSPSLWAWARALSSSTRKWWITFQISHKGFKDFRKKSKITIRQFFFSNSSEQIFLLWSHYQVKRLVLFWHNQPNGSAKGVVLAEELGSMPGTGDNNFYASALPKNVSFSLPVSAYLSLSCLNL